MKEAITQPDLSVKLIDSPTPTPDANEIIIKVVIAAANPIDWKGVLPEDQVRLHGELEAKQYHNNGKDVAGYVHAVGSSVEEFKPGDRVAATYHGSGYAEYSVAPAFTAYRIPDNTTFEEAATYGLPYITAALGLFRTLGLSEPWRPASTNTPLVIYGASSAVGAYAVKLASLSNIHPIVAVAGRGGAAVSSQLDKGKGDILIDYRRFSQPGLVEELHRVAPQAKSIFDAISTPETINLLGKVVDPSSGVIGIVLNQETPPQIDSRISLPLVFAPALWEPTATDVGSQDTKGSEHVGLRAFAFQYYHYLQYALSHNLISNHPYEVLPEGLNGIPTALKNLKDGVSSGVKYLFRISDTEGIHG